jgi:hypothetical protein
MSQTQAGEQVLKSDDATRQREAHFDALISGVEDYAIFLLSPEGNVISWNAGAQRIKGYKPEEIIGKHFSVFYPQEAIERGWPGNVLRRAAKEGRFATEGWRVRKDGSRFWGSVVITALRAENGAVRGFLKITRDLTERRKFEELQEADRLKDNFLAKLSHEFRTHLNAILGWTSLMKESLDDAALISKGLDVLERNTKTLTGLIADLTDISKITAGTLTLDFEEVDLKQVVSSSVETLRVQAAEKGIALECFVQIPEGIDCRIWADELRLQQILANILSNSLKFTSEGGSVSVQLRKDPAAAILLVKDTGEGISPEFLPYVFEQFSQAKSNRSENRGMGLGLAICKHLVELHQGSIQAESEGLGYGTTVKVELPLTASNSPARFEQTRQHAFTGEKRMRDTRLGSIKVLAVDDDADTRDLLSAILERSGAEATVLGSGKEALELVKNSRPDVLICDLAMPQMDGYELLKNVRRLEPEVGWFPVIAFTASVRNEDRDRSQEAGFQAHLAKPLIPNELVTTIIELVGNKTHKE